MLSVKVVKLGDFLDESCQPVRQVAPNISNTRLFSKGRRGSMLSVKVVKLGDLLAERGKSISETRDIHKSHQSFFSLFSFALFKFIPENLFYP